MRNGVSFVFLFLLVVGVVAFNTTCCKATTEQKDKEGSHLPKEEVEAEPGKEAKHKSTSESWAEWAKEKLSEGLGGFRNSDDEGGIHSETSNINIDAAKKTKDKITDTVTGAAQHTAEEAEDKKNAASEKAKEKGCEASDAILKKSGETKEKVAEKARDTKEAAMDAGKKAAEEGKKIEGEAEEKLHWAKEKAKEGYEAAKTKAGETYESARDTFESAKDDIIETGTGGGRGHNEEL